MGATVAMVAQVAMVVTVAEGEVAGVVGLRAGSVAASSVQREATMMVA